MIEIDKLCEELKDKYDLPLKAEHEQVSFYQKVQTALIICIVAAILINGFIMIFNHGGYEIFSGMLIIVGLVISIVVVLVVFGFISGKKVQEYNRKYTNSVGKEMLSKYYDNVNIYDGDAFGYEELFNSVGYQESYNEIWCDKQIDLKYKGKDIKLMQLDVSHETTDKDGNTEVETIFYGLFIEVDLGYKIGTKMSIVENYNLGIGKDKLEMDSKEFEDSFNVYTDDKVKSMQLLTADVMETFKQMYQNASLGFNVSFVGDKLFIRINRADSLFSYGTEEVIEKKYINEDMQDLYLITAIIDNIDYAVEANHVL